MADESKCRSCQASLPAGTTACPTCGPIVRCSKCAAFVKHGTKACPACQADLDPVPTALPAGAKRMDDLVTRTTAVLAVLAALSSGQWGNSNLRAILEQGKVNDQWAFYQAKSIKQRTAEEITGLGRAMVAGKEVSPDMAAFLKAMDDTAQQEKLEKEEAKADAVNYETIRDQRVGSSFWFQIAFACLQVGVVLCTIAAAAKSRGLWAVSILAGFLGLAVLANGIGGWMPAPEGAAAKATKDLATKLPSPEPGK